MQNLNLLLAKPLIGTVKVYQKTLSPDHSLLKKNYPDGYCRFYPSCSSYAINGLEVDGLKSIPRVFYRILRCQPWSLGGVDPYVKDNLVTHKH